MKSNQITVGQDYAVSTYGNAREGMFTDHLSRATIVRSLGNSHWLAHVEGYNRESDLRAVQIIGTWDDYAKGQADKRAAAKARKERNVAGAQAIAGYLPAGTRLPFGFDGHIYNDGSYATEGKLTVHDLKNLLRLAFEHGQENPNR